jgi:EAL domain-containing protein (putative c-di-GMP-specific phosphodiesterase class I)
MVSRGLTAPSIGDIITTRGTITHFQPILSARRKSIVGLEALSRGAVEPGQLIAPKVLFQMAAQSGLRMHLERACHESAMRSFARLTERPADLVLFLNLSLTVMREHDATARLLGDVVHASGVSSRQVALEILEGEIDDMAQLSELVASFREAGFLLVLDDVGAGHSNLDRIPLIKPDILKIDRSLIAGVERDYYKQETVKSLIGLSRTIGALVVAEGVETEDEAIVALELGADLLQGYFLALPAAVQSARGERLTLAVDRMDAVAQKFKRHMVRKIHDRRLEHRRCHLVMTQIRDQLVKASDRRVRPDPGGHDSRVPRRRVRLRAERGRHSGDRHDCQSAGRPPRFRPDVPAHAPARGPLAAGVLLHPPRRRAPAIYDRALRVAGDRQHRSNNQHELP